MKQCLAGIMMALLLSVAGATAGQSMYEVGTAYVYYPWTSDEEIVRDLETMAATGINSVNPFPPFRFRWETPSLIFRRSTFSSRPRSDWGCESCPPSSSMSTSRTRLLPNTRSV